MYYIYIYCISNLYNTLFYWAILRDLSAWHRCFPSLSAVMLKTLNMKRYKVHQIVFAVTCVQVLRILLPPSTFVEARTREDLTLRRHFFSNLGAQVLGASSTAAIESTGPTFRTQRTVPEIPVATAVILLRTTQEAALDWGGPFSKPGLYQTNFNKKRSEGLEWSFAEHARRKMTNLRRQL